MTCARRSAGAQRLAPSAGSPSRPDPLPERNRARLSLLPVLALLLAALSPFAAPPAAAQDAVWSATLTVGALVTGQVGCEDERQDIPGGSCHPSGRLTDDEFSYDGVTYNIHLVRYEMSASQVVIAFDRTIPQRLKNSGLALTVGSRTFALADAFLSSTGGGRTNNLLVWTGVTLTGFTAGARVQLSLGRPPPAPVIKGVKGGDRYLDVEWAPVAVATGYDVHFTSSSLVADGAALSGKHLPDFGWVAVSRSGTATSQRIAGVYTEGSPTYRVRVRARNAHGPGAWAFRTGAPRAGFGAPPVPAPGNALWSAILRVQATNEDLA